MPAGFGTTYSVKAFLVVGIPAFVAGLTAELLSQWFELGTAATILIAALALGLAILLFACFCSIAGAILDRLFPRKITPCPKCGRPLATRKAQQCLHCGADWHVRRPTSDAGSKKRTTFVDVPGAQREKGRRAANSMPTLARWRFRVMLLHRDAVDLLEVGGPGMGHADPDGYVGYAVWHVPRHGIPEELLFINSELWLEPRGDGTTAVYRQEADEQPVATIKRHKT